jgi:hypothetical protein
MNSQLVALRQSPREKCPPAAISGRRASVAAPPPPPPPETLLLLVIDARRARVYKVRFLEGVPRQVLPYDPFGYRHRSNHHCDHSPEEPLSVADSSRRAAVTTLRGSAKVLVFASGLRAGPAMENYLDYFRNHHPDVARRLIGSMTLSESEVSEDELLANVRAFWALIDATVQ